jgi:hypothetical protein
MKFLGALGAIGKEVLKLTVIGGMTVTNNELHQRTKSMSSDVASSVGRGFDHYAKPTINKSLNLVRRKKD